MAQVSYKNSRNGDVVTLDTTNDDDKRAIKRLDRLDNWSKVATEKAADAPAPVEKPGPKASRKQLLDFASNYASDAEKGTLERMTDDELRAFVEGVDHDGGPVAGPAAGV